MRTTDRDILYHVAPRSARSVIEQEGLRADLSQWPETRPGVYFWNDPERAEEWRRYVEDETGSLDPQPQDIWAVHDVHCGPDPLVAAGESFVGFIPIKHSRYSPDHVAPQHLRMHAESPVPSGDGAGALDARAAVYEDSARFSAYEYSLDPQIRSIQESWKRDTCGGEVFIPHENSPWVQYQLASQEADTFDPMHTELDGRDRQPCGEI